MGRKKKTSKVLGAAQKRVAGLKAIDPKLDLGAGLTVPAFQTAIDGLSGNLDSYNTLLSQADEALNQVQKSEKDVRALNDRFLAGVRSRYGADSDEYEKAGGTRTSERKKKGQGPRAKKKKKAAQPPPKA